jgi:hypothetical protein
VGLSRAALDVGSGRETEVDAFVAMGGGLAYGVSESVSLGIRASHLWIMATDGGKGIVIVPSIQFRI